MTYYWIVGVSGIFLASCLILFRKFFFGLVERTTSLLNVMLDKSLSDHDKQSSLVSRLGSLVISLGSVIVLLAITVVVTIAPIFFYSKVVEQSIQQPDLSSGSFYLALSLGSILPFLVYGRFGKKADYSDWSKLLHRIILNNPNISESLYHLEAAFFLSKKKSFKTDFLIVTGLARAGTTALTTLLHGSPLFYSLSYANMPFLLSPNLWGKVYRPKSALLKERSHGDRVLFGYNTVEALEEHFWKVFTRDGYIKNDSLTPHEVNTELYHNYLRYQQLIRRYTNKGSVYLSKNNNFMLRYSSLRKLNEDFKVILLFRDPVSHANSLLSQHQRYKKLQGSDGFVREYMNWLGHHEFGLDHKPLVFHQDGAIRNQMQDSMGYWVNIWIDYYENIFDYLSDKNLVLLDYQDFLMHPRLTLKTLENKFQMTIEVQDIAPFTNPKKTTAVDDPSLEARANELYQRLLEKKIEIS